MSNKCVNYSSKEWKDLVAKFGLEKAQFVTYKNNMDVPSIVEATKILEAAQKAAPAKLTESNKRKIIEGVNFYFMEALFNHGDPEMLTQTEVNAKTINDLFDLAFKRVLTEDLKAKYSTLKTQAEKDAFNKLGRTLSSSIVQEELKEYYRAYLKSFNIEVESEQNETDIISKDNAFAKEGHKVSLDDSLYGPVKMLIAGLSDGTRNDLGLPKLVDYEKTKNYLANNLSGLPSDYKHVADKLKLLSKRRPELKQLLNKLGESILPTDSIKKMRLKMQFMQSFSKNKNSYFLSLIKRDGNILTFDSNANKLKDKLRLTWYNNLKDVTIAGDFPLYFKSTIKDKIATLEKSFKNISPASALIKKANMLGEIFKDLGIELSDKTLQDNYEDALTILNRIVGYSDLISASDLYEGEEVSGAINDLIDIEAKYSDEVELQSINAEGETVFGISLNSYLSLMVNEMNTYSGNEDALRKNLPHLFHVNSKNSIFLERLLQGADVKLDIIDGVRVESEDGVATKDVEIGDKWVMQINNALQGFYTYLRAADRGIENGFRISGGLLVNSKANTVDTLVKYLEDEINTSKAYKKGLGKDIKYYNQTVPGSKYAEGERLKIFRNIISIPEDALQKEIASPDFDFNTFYSKYKTTIDNDINSWLTSEVNKVQAEISKYLLDAGEDIGISKELIEEYGTLENVVELSTLNQIVAYIEQTKLFVGDPTFFKNSTEIFKRTSMFNGTKKVSAVGEQVDEWLNTNMPRLDGKKYDSKFTSIIFEDTKAKSDMLGMIEEIISNAGDLSLKGAALKAYLKAYEEMEEADAQGYITLDAYRELLWRAGDWTDAHEKIYQDEMEFYREVMQKGNTDFKNTYKPSYDFVIQPLKTQHIGPMTNKLDDVDSQSLYVPTGYKHSLMPLLPSVVHGRNMENLLKYMVDNKQDIGQHTSANKYGTIVNTNNKANTLYNEDGSVNPENFITQDTFYKYIGIQLDIAPKIKTETLISTQDRKLTLSNLYNDGEIRNTELQAIAEEYDSLHATLVNRGLKEIIEEMGLEPVLNNEGVVVSYNTVDRTKFTKYIKRSAEQRNNPTNVIKAIERLQDKEVVVDSLLFRDKVINLLNAALERKTIRIKRFGGSKPQTSSSLMESKGSKREGKIKASNYLRFYRKNGRTGGLLPMQIERSIPKEWKTWVKRLGGLDKFNEMVAETVRLYDEYNSEEGQPVPNYPIDPRLLIAKGFRIPNQGLNSTDSAMVVRFLPYIAGDMLIVPTEMVAKAGSDFDIDKFNLYFANTVLEEPDGTNVVDAVNARLKNRKYNIDTILNIYDQDPSERSETDQYVLKIYNEEVEKATNVVYDEYRGVDSQPQKSQIENRLLELETELILHKENSRQLLAPISDYIIKDVMLKQIDALRGYNSTETITDVVSPANVMTKFKNFLAGKAGVGQTAVHLTNHTLAQKAGLYINDRNPSLFFNHNVNKDGYPSLGGVLDVNGNYMISETLSAFLNAYVDIAKDPYIFRLNAGTKVANTIFYLLRLGADPVWVAKLINQPSVMKYVELQGIEEAEFIKSNEELKNKLTKKNRISTILSSYNSKLKEPSLLYSMSAKLKEIQDDVTQEEKINELQQKIAELKEVYKNSPLTDSILTSNIQKASDNIQVAALDQFLEYQRQAVMFQEMVRATSPDTKGLGKDSNSVKSLLELQQKVADDAFIGNVDKVFDQSFIGSFNNVIKQTNLIYKEYLISEHPKFSSKLRAMQQKYNAVTRSVDAKEKITARIYDDFIMHLLQSTFTMHDNKFNFLGVPFESVKKMFFGNDSLAKHILAIKKGIVKNETELKNNPLIAELTSMIEDESNHNLKIFSRKLNTHAQNVLTDAFREIYEIDPKLGDALTKFALVQSGLNNSPITFVKYIPEEKYFDIVNKVLTFVKTNTTKVDMDAFEKQFELQNMKFNPRYNSRYVNNEYYEGFVDETISKDHNKGEFFYLRRSLKHKDGEYRTMVYKRSDNYNASGNYTYKLLGETNINYLSPKQYSAVFNEQNYIKQEKPKC